MMLINNKSTWQDLSQSWQGGWHLNVSVVSLLHNLLTVAEARQDGVLHKATLWVLTASLTVRVNGVKKNSERNMQCEKMNSAFQTWNNYKCEKEWAVSYLNRKQICNAKKNKTRLIQTWNKYAMRKRMSRVYSNQKHI